MGLDNYFLIKKDDKYFEIGYFRKFYELDDFITTMCKPTEGNSYTFLVDREALKMLKEEIEPIFKVLIKADEKYLCNYDDYGYPKKFRLDRVEFINNNFNPINSRSYACGIKVINLYHLVCTLLNSDCDDVLFISSW